MKDKIVKILENGTEGNYLLTAGNIERIATQIAKLYQPAVSEGEIIHTLCNDSGEGTIIKTPQADAQQRYEKAKKLTLECTGNKILSEFEEDILSIAAGLSPQEKGGEG